MMWTDLALSLARSAIGVLVLMLVAFGVALRIKRNSVADIAWGLGFIASAAVAFVFDHAYTTRQILVLVMVACWGLRLAVHIYLRNQGKGEDRRYADLIRRHGNGWWTTFSRVFLTQGVLLLIVGLPVSVVMAASLQPTLMLLDYLGVLVWLIGFVWESMADYQLSRFLSNASNRGKIMTEGLWRYSRHPNYFGEITQWWAVAVIALSVPHGWIGLIGPIVITVFIIYISGIPLLERHYDGNPDYEAYRRRTSVLVPWPSKQV